MGLEIGKLVALVQGVLLEVNARRVDVSARDDGSIFKALLADDGQHECLAAIVEVDLIACLELHTVDIFDKALILGHFDSHFHGLALCARIV